MKNMLDENPSRNSIIHLLKKHGGMSIDELSRRINITPMGIRQHLLSLEKKGIVTYVPRRHGIGRPGFIYMLTDKADDLFPKSYDRFAIEMLQDIRDQEGNSKLDKIFGWRKERLLKKRGKALGSLLSVREKIEALRDILESEGYMVELSNGNSHYHLKQYNCPISRISAEFPGICRHELEFYRELFGRGVTMERHITPGEPTCSFMIPAF